MIDGHPRQHSDSGPFGMGWQGYLIVANVVIVSALFAATRRDWASLLLSALGLPLLMLALIYGLSRLGRRAPARHNSPGRPRGDVDLLAFLARTNPFLFLLLGALSRRSDEDNYQELLRSGPYGLGRSGYLLALLLLLVPLIGALLMVAVTGQQPTHLGP